MDQSADETSASVEIGDGRFTLRQWRHYYGGIAIDTPLSVYLIARLASGTRNEEGLAGASAWTPIAFYVLSWVLCAAWIGLAERRRILDNTTITRWQRLATAAAATVYATLTAVVMSSLAS